MKRRGATPEEDRANGWIEEGLITKIAESDAAWDITTNDLWTTQLRKDRSPDTPRIGDTFTTFGQIGYAFHGQALNGRVLWYQSVEDEEAQHRQDLADGERRKRERFEADRARLDAEYAALPETFRDRIDKFRATNPDFRWFGFAVRLAYWYVTDPGAVVAEHGALTPLVGCGDYGCPHPDLVAS